MTPIEMLSLLSVLVIASLLRLIPSRLNGYFGSDAFYHLMVARKERELGHLPEKDPGLVPEMTRVYPPLLHTILYPFKGIGERVALLGLSPIIDVIAMLVLYFIGDELGVKEPLWPVALYAVSPLNVVDAASLNARPIANLALTLVFMFSYLYWQNGDLLYLIVIALSGAGVMLSNKMAVQVFAPCAVAVSIVAMLDSPHRGIFLLASFLLAVGVATIVTLGGYLRKTLPDHIRFMRVHMAHGDYGEAKRALPSPLRLAKANPISVFAPFLGLYWLYEVGSDDLMLFLVVWALPVLLLAQFWIWGDSWRYLQFGTIPSVLIVGYALARTELLGHLGGAVLAFILAALLVATIIQLSRAVKTDPAARLIAAVRKLPPEWRTKLDGALVYSNMSHYSVPYELGAKMFSGNPSSEGMELYFKAIGKGTDSLKSIAELAKETLGRPLDYYILFKGFKESRRDGFKVLLESESIAILAE